MSHGGGVAGALRRAAGRDWDKESERYILKNGPLEVKYQTVQNLFIFFHFFRKVNVALLLVDCYLVVLLFMLLDLFGEEEIEAKLIN